METEQEEPLGMEGDRTRSTYRSLPLPANVAMLDRRDTFVGRRGRLYGIGGGPRYCPGPDLTPPCTKTYDLPEWPGRDRLWNQGWVPATTERSPGSWRPACQVEFTAVAGLNTRIKRFTESMVGLFRHFPGPTIGITRFKLCHDGQKCLV